MNTFFIFYTTPYGNIHTQGLVWLQWAAEGNETERVNGFVRTQKDRGACVSMFRSDTLKRLKFNWSTSLGAGLSTNAQRPTNLFDGYLPTRAMADQKASIVKKIQIVRITLLL